MPKKKEILLETGTNEIEILEFTIDGKHYGINVAKIFELIQYQEVIPMPNSNVFVKGVFKRREQVLTLINLPAYLGHLERPDQENDIFIVTNFNKSLAAFHIHTVEEIHRISWDKIEKPDLAIYGDSQGLATGIARIDERLVTIVDFEKIMTDISPQQGIQISSLDKLGARTRSDKPILIAEDSTMLERLIIECLTKAEYTNIITTTNGKEAWEKLQEFKNLGGPIEDHVRLVITDLEMPQMDGHHLIKLIRGDAHISHLPVVIFSSLISPEMRRKGEDVGATAQISKPEIAGLVKLIDDHIF